MKALFVAVNAALKALAEYPHSSKPTNALLATDKQVFVLQQQALAELLLFDEPGAGEQVKIAVSKVLHSRTFI